MAETLTPDICVIGAGSGGLSVAAGAAMFGLSVVLVEKGLMGGDCLNYGCVPSKALLAAAKHAHTAASGKDFGVSCGTPEVDFAAVNRHVRRTIDAIAPNDSVARFGGLGVTVIQAEGRFVSKTELEADGRRIAARKFVVATGSAPMVPPIAGLAGTPYLTNETLFENTEKPEHLLILGGGPIGMEMAQAHLRLGSRVTVLEAAEPLSKDDPELSRIVLNRLRREGVEIRFPAKVIGVEHEAGRFTLRLETPGGDGSTVVAGSHLLIAAGRAANVEGLGLDAAGVTFDKRGIKVDRALRSSNRRIFAIGDVAGLQQFTHIANYHAGLVLRSIMFRWPVRRNDTAIPWVTFTDPELAWVGLSEEEARASHRDVRLMRWPLAENDRAQAERSTEGLIKALTDRKGRILGAGIVGAHAGELILPWVMAITQRQKISAMTSMIVPYPTLAEVSKRAAYGYYTPMMLRSSLPRLVRFWVRAL